MFIMQIEDNSKGIRQNAAHWKQNATTQEPTNRKKRREEATRSVLFFYLSDINSRATCAMQPLSLA
jgi:hypothetical protein